MPGHEPGYQGLQDTSTVHYLKADVGQFCPLLSELLGLRHFGHFSLIFHLVFSSFATWGGEDLKAIKVSFYKEISSQPTCDRFYHPRDNGAADDVGEAAGDGPAQDHVLHRDTVHNPHTINLNS